MNVLEAFAGAAATQALNALPAGLLIALLAWLVQRVAQKQSSSLRFSVWFAALVGIAGLPFLPRFGAGAQVAANNVSASIFFPNSWAVVLLASWAVVALLGIARLLLGLWRVQRLKKNAWVADVSAAPAQIRQTIENCSSVRRVKICISREMRVPAAVGFFRPAILFPEWTWNELSEDDMRAVILHEFAHLERRDDWTNLAQKVIAALFFFHPAVWWIDRRLAIEREIACDELVLAKTGNRQAYARCLLSLAEKGFLRRGMVMAQTAISHTRDLTVRLTRILAPERGLKNPVLKPSLVLAGLGALISAAAVAGTPELIAFRPPVEKRARAAAVSSAGISAAQIVPASLPLAPSAAKPQLKQARLVRESNRQMRVSPAVGKQTTTNRPRVVNAAIRRIPAPQFLVLTQTTHFDDFGDARISFTLWRVTMPSGSKGVPQAEVIARSL